jgi:hypothetical protein
MLKNQTRFCQIDGLRNVHAGMFEIVEAYRRFVTSAGYSAIALRSSEYYDRPELVSAAEFNLDNASRAALYLRWYIVGVQKYLVTPPNRLKFRNTFGFEGGHI